MSTSARVAEPTETTTDLLAPGMDAVHEHASLVARGVRMIADLGTCHADPSEMQTIASMLEVAAEPGVIRFVMDRGDGRAVYGFAGFLLRYLAEERPTHLGVAFDESLETSFRNELYPAYKAQRERPPPEIVAE